MIETRIHCDRPGCRALLPEGRTTVAIGSGTGRKGRSLNLDYCDVHAAELRAFLDPTGRASASAESTRPREPGPGLRPSA